MFQRTYIYEIRYSSGFMDFIVFFAYKIYDAISGPINFNQVKNERYAVVIDRLKDIRTAQIAHKDVKGEFSNNFDSLVKFVDEGILL